MKLNILIFIGLVLTVSGCGGDGSGFETIAGNWSGQMFQASGINCSDGTFIGAGLGSPTRVISFVIEGGDVLDASASLSLNGCDYIGTREEESEITFYSSDESCLESVKHSEIDGGMATTTLDSRPAKPDSQGQPTCTIAEQGEVTKDG